MALTDVSIRNLKPETKSYKKGDGGGLYIQVTPSGGKLWRLKYNRAQHWSERVAMLQWWSDYLDGLKAGGKVIPMTIKEVG